MFRLFIIRPLLEASGSHIRAGRVCYYLWANPSPRLILPRNHQLTRVISRRSLNGKQDVSAYPRRRFSCALTGRHSSEPGRRSAGWVMNEAATGRARAGFASPVVAPRCFEDVVNRLLTPPGPPPFPHLCCQSKVSEPGPRGLRSGRVFTQVKERPTWWVRKPGWGEALEARAHWT